MIRQQSDIMADLPTSAPPPPKENNSEAERRLFHAVSQWSQRGFPSSNNFNFPGKLHKLLFEAERRGQTDIISWNDNGVFFKVHQKELFARYIMPEFFQTSTYKSFQRNLNLWGFGRTSRGERFHPLFVRGRPELCQGIKRVTKKSDKAVQQPLRTSQPVVATRPAETLRSSILRSPTASNDNGVSALAPSDSNEAILRELMRPQSSTSSTSGLFAPAHAPAPCSLKGQIQQQLMRHETALSSLLQDQHQQHMSALFTFPASHNLLKEQAVAAAQHLQQQVKQQRNQQALTNDLRLLSSLQVIGTGIYPDGHQVRTQDQSTS